MSVTHGPSLLDNYLVTLDLTSASSTSDGKNYKMTKIDSLVPKIKDMAFWSNAANSTLYQYGGRYLDNVTSENTIWTYTVGDKSWDAQVGSIQPTRLEYGGMLDISHHSYITITSGVLQ